MTTLPQKRSSVLERPGLSLYQKIYSSMPDTTNSLIEPQEVVKPIEN